MCLDITRIHTYVRKVIFLKKLSNYGIQTLHARKGFTSSWKSNFIHDAAPDPGSGLRSVYGLGSGSGTPNSWDSRRRRYAFDGIEVRVGDLGSMGPMAATGDGQIRIGLRWCRCPHRIQAMSSAWDPMLCRLGPVTEENRVASLPSPAQGRSRSNGCSRADMRRG
jgi:hypothetical protein